MFPFIPPAFILRSLNINTFNAQILRSAEVRVPPPKWPSCWMMTLRNGADFHHGSMFFSGLSVQLSSNRGDAFTAVLIGSATASPVLLAAFLLWAFLLTAEGNREPDTWHLTFPPTIRLLCAWPHLDRTRADTRLLPSSWRTTAARTFGWRLCRDREREGGRGGGANQSEDPFKRPLKWLKTSSGGLGITLCTIAFSLYSAAAS